MPFALLLIGLVLVVSGVKNTLGELATTVKSDFSGEGNFFYWITAIGAVGAVGYIPSARTFSRMFLTLILVAMVLSNRGFFAQFGAAIGSITAPAPASANAIGSDAPATGGTSAPPALGIIRAIDGATGGTVGALPGTGAVRNFLSGFGLTF